MPNKLKDLMPDSVSPSTELKSAVDLVNYSVPPTIVPIALHCMQSSKKLTALKQKLSQAGDDVINVYTNGRALRKHVETLERSFIARAQARYSEPIGHIDNAIGGMILESRGAGVELASASQLLEVIENTPQFKAALNIIEPLVGEIAKLEAEEAEAQHEVLRKNSALEEARRAAEAKAIEEAQKHPDVIAAAKALKQTEAAAYSKLAAT